MSYGNNAPARIVAVQKVALGAASVDSAALNARTKRVRINATLGAYWHMAGTPTATASTGFIGVGENMEFDVNSAHLIAGLQFATGGSLFIYELDF